MQADPRHTAGAEKQADREMRSRWKMPDSPECWQDRRTEEDRERRDKAEGAAGLEIRILTAMEEGR